MAIKIGAIEWWKWLSLAIMLYVCIYGLLGPVPRLPIINETIRNTYFHVTMWFGMIGLLFVSFIYSIRHLTSNDSKFDDYIEQSVSVSLLFGVMGILSGMIWANYTWGEPWSNDPKQNAAAIGLLIYFAFFLFRNSIKDKSMKARLSAIYMIFSFPIFISLIYILPRLTDSLHPGAGGNAGFGTIDIDKDVRMVFYPAILGWFLMGWWLVQLNVRVKRAQQVLVELSWEDKNS